MIVVVGLAYVLNLSSYDDNVINLDMERQVGDVNTSLGSPLLGSASAPVTIIEFGDYQCPNCKIWFLNIKPDIVTNYIDTEKANLIFVDIAFLGKDSMPAARATYCAEEQERFWDYHAFLYTNQMGIDNGWANIDSLKGYPSNLEFDMDLFVSCMDSGKYERKIKYSTYEAKRNAINKLPTFIIIDSVGNYEKISGFQPFLIFEEKIKLLQN